MLTRICNKGKDVIDVGLWIGGMNSERAVIASEHSKRGDLLLNIVITSLRSRRGDCRG